MSAADEVADHICGSLLDLRRRLDVDTAVEVALAVLRGAEQALQDLNVVDEGGRRASAEVATGGLAERQHRRAQH